MCLLPLNHLINIAFKSQERVIGRLDVLDSQTVSKLVERCFLFLHKYKNNILKYV